MNSGKGIGCGTMILIVFLLMWIISAAGGSDDSGGRCVGCGSHTSWKYKPNQGWWCYSCTH